ncbi:transcriptional regulator [Marinigracilibium pacificum]|uniref:Transcriptional regulator n=1 Tax=Marinigracilibium pacificum TaxID=2729599 RepID=A0A848IY09_9BACT|nr:transcriptional regulator [Marinigracilibium pacificum]NMM48211.1 transcriptional regulator [Marinigracilibium pacificum]
MTGIITGDIIQSGKMLGDPLWMNVLKDELPGLAITPKDWDIFSGDSFQLEVDPSEGIKTMLVIKSLLLFKVEVDTRLALGIGSKTFSGDSISESNGEAFINSGRLLKELKNVSMAIKTPFDDFDDSINLMLELGCLTFDKWTPSSAEAVYYFLSEKVSTQKDLASILDIGQGRVSERLGRAGYEQIIKLDNYYKNTLHQQPKHS